jgi:hypothetical protein
MVIFPVSNQTVLQTNLSMQYERFMKLETNTKVPGQARARSASEVTRRWRRSRKRAMTRIAWTLMIAGWWAMQGAAQPSATEQAQQRLQALVQPGRPSEEPRSGNSPARMTTQPLRLPEAPLPKANPAPPALPRPAAKVSSPRPPREDSPLAHSFGQPEPPQVMQLPSEPLVRLWQPDVQEPVPLPILGTAVRDRASLADPSLEASVAATQRPVAVSRVQPVPFQPMNLPNPFEHAEAVRLQRTFEERLP